MPPTVYIERVYPRKVIRKQQTVLATKFSDAHWEQWGHFWATDVFPKQRWAVWLALPYFLTVNVYWTFALCQALDWACYFWPQLWASRVLENITKLSEVLQQSSGRVNTESQSPTWSRYVYFLPEQGLLVRRPFGCLRVTPGQWGRLRALWMGNAQSNDFMLQVGSAVIQTYVCALPPRRGMDQGAFREDNLWKSQQSFPDFVVYPP